MTYPSFTAGEVLRAADMNAVGLWLVKTQTVGTGVSTVAVTSAFSSDYDNYRIVITTNSGSTDAAFFLRLTGSSTAYYYSNLQNNFGGSNGTDKAENATGWRIGSNDGTNGTYAILDVMRPNLAQVSFMSFNGIYGDTGGTSWYGGGMHNVASAYTGFEIYPNAGTFTGGTIRVYGYQK